MALKLGDPTAKELGRLTLNPIPHIDPVGSILVPTLSILSAGTVFIAWAKPVPINPLNFRDMRRDDILVSVVGPASNLVVALACALLYVVVERALGPVEGMPEGIAREAVLFVLTMASFGIRINIFLAVFNLLPVPPLDGSHVVASLLPPEVGERFRRIGFFGIIIVLVLMNVPEFRSGVIGIVRMIELPYDWLIEALL
ncbi:MAG: site-2 protease family protein, partial [Ignavibacteriales bacterium]|nr:site-2 protease family protein [Ignavibacteriales bacterium]